jgi:subtilisin family serine protease/PKD repeat protein
MNKRDFIFVLLFIFSGIVAFAQSPKKTPSNIHPDIIIIKLKVAKSPDARIEYSPGNLLEKIKQLSQAQNTQQVFPQKTLSNARSMTNGLQNIYKLELPTGTDIWRLLAKLKNSGLVEYAEPYYENELLYVPNDPQANLSTGKQTYLSVVKAYDAWNTEKADTSIVIGIVDTGVNMNHEDLHNIAYNFDDPVNGLDDDEDGYIDNFHGWDIADNDNDPTADGHPHGTPVTGMSSAATNNGIGMAGTGFNSRYLPVKIALTSTQQLTREYEGIIYAANHGARVINLSWGGAGNFFQYGQDIINYAVLEKDVVVVAAAGNTNDELNFYPASFENVLSVGATDINDNKASWATYSYHIDITAPGDNVYTTKNDGGYEITTGSSFSSPMVAGAAALVRAHFPDLTAIQVMEQLRITSDDIYDIGSNNNYTGKLGRGRLNIQRALSDILTPSVRLSDMQYQSNHGDLIFPGDTVNVTQAFTNYLRQAKNLTINISNASDNVTLESEEIYIYSLDAFQSYVTSDQPLTFVVNDNVLPGDRLTFRVDFLGNFYEDFQYFEIRLTPDYFDISDGNIAATISSDGDIGFDDEDFRDGNGISFENELITSNAGLIISQDKDHVIDNVINNFNDFTKDQDFISERPVRLYDNSIADYDARSIFRAKDTVSSALPVRVEQKVLAWDNPTENGYLIFEYRIINTGDSIISGINAGLFADWDLGDYETNEVATDEVLKLGYAFDKSSGNRYSGLALLTDQAFSHYAIDLASLNGNVADLDSVFSDSLKHEFLASNIPKTQAGTLGAGNDVAQMLGAKQFDLLPKETAKVTIAMLASNSLDGLKQVLNSAKEKYALYQENPPEGETFYACLGDSALVDPMGELYEFYQDRQLTQRLDSGLFYETPPIVQDTFYYAVNLDSGYYSDVMKLNVRLGNPTADFELNTDTLLIEAGKTGRITVKNTSALGSSWTWEFDNGYSSSVKEPTSVYEDPGTYNIQLIASNEYGCRDTTHQKLLVALRSERPAVENQQICKNTSTTISATNTDEIRVYSDAGLTMMLFDGNAFETGRIIRDTLFYVTNGSGPFESLPTKVEINALAPAMGFSYVPDTSDLDDRYALRIVNTNGPTDSLYWFVDDLLISRDSSFSHIYSDQPFEVRQVKADNYGCADTLTTVVKPSYSSMPDDDQIEVCKNAPFIVAPVGGDLFYFYADQNLTQRLHKGRTYPVEKADQSTTYFVTGVDQLLESSSAIIEVNVNPVRAAISVASDSILLEDASDIEIINASEHATESFWLHPTGSFDTTSVLVDNYDEIGKYTYRLVALGTNGCSDTTLQEITIYSVTSLKDLNSNTIRIFPNPISSGLTIDLGENPDRPVQFQLISPSGQSIRQFTLPKAQKSMEISLSDLPNGIYLIRAISGGPPLSWKVVKR